MARILIVDDDPKHLACARELLEAEGYEVDTHQTAFGATERLIRTRPDLVLIAVNRPARSGEVLATILRRRVHAAGVRVYLYASDDEGALRRAASRLALDGYVCKGDPAALRRKVSRALAGSRGRGATSTSTPTPTPTPTSTSTSTSTATATATSTATSTSHRAAGAAYPTASRIR